VPDASNDPPRLGERIIIVGNTNAGKSTLGARLAEHLDVPHIELDALFWQPGWTEPPREEFRARVAEAVQADRWVMSGSYFDVQGDISWPLATQVLWLDVGLLTVIPRILHRSWNRYRRNELLWGTNRERFWGQLRVWSDDSLIGFAVKRGGDKRRRLEARMADPRWSHIDFVRLRGTRAIDSWVETALASSLQKPDLEDPSWRSA
jgi:adenylate kinase family enzyme